MNEITFGEKEYLHLTKDWLKRTGYSIIINSNVEHEQILLKEVKTSSETISFILSMQLQNIVHAYDNFGIDVLIPCNLSFFINKYIKVFVTFNYSSMYHESFTYIFFKITKIEVEKEVMGDSIIKEFIF